METTPTTTDKPRSHLAKLIPLGMALVLFGLLVPLPFESRLASALGDFCHAPIFAAVTIAVLLILNHFRPTGGNLSRLAIRCLLVFLAVTIFGVATEWLQGLMGRSKALHDAIANGLGSAAGACFFLGRDDKATKIRRGVWVVGIVLMSVAWYRPIALLDDIRRVSGEFPVLCSFDSKIQLTRWFFRNCSGTLSTENVTDGNHSGEIHYIVHKQPSATLIYLHNDWSRMKSLRLDAVLDQEYEGDEVTLIIKVIARNRTSDQDGRFRYSQVLRPGEKNSIEILREDIINGSHFRELDLNDIQYLSIGLVNPTAPTVVRIDAVRLEL